MSRILSYKNPIWLIVSTYVYYIPEIKKQGQFLPKEPISFLVFIVPILFSSFTDFSEDDLISYMLTLLNSYLNVNSSYFCQLLYVLEDLSEFYTIV